MKSSSSDILQFKKQPWQLLFFFAVLLLIMMFFKEDRIVSINLSDTYLGVNARSLTLILIAHMVPFLLVYAFLKRPFYSIRLVWVNTIVSVLGSIVLFIAIWHTPIESLAGAPRRYYDIGIEDAGSSVLTYNNLVYLAIVLLLIGHLLFLINLVLTFSKKGTRSGSWNDTTTSHRPMP